MFDTPTLLLRLADFHLGATLLLSATLVAGYFLRQPARRLTFAWSSAVAIVVLGVLCCVPGWSMLHVFRAETQQGTASWPSDFEKSLSQAATGFQATPTESFQAAPSTSPPAEIIVKSPAASFAFDPTLAAITVGTLGTLLCSVWLVAGALSAKRIIHAATPAGERLQNLLREVAAEKTLPRLLVSERLSVAAAIGLRRPAILLPASLDETATDNDLRGLLAHELAHIRNGDLRLLALWRLLLVPLWMNPLYWLLRRRMRLDQETLADAVAAEQTNRQEYAKRLVGWAREMSTGSGHPRLAGAAGLWESPSQLRRRITVLLDERLTLLRRCSRRWRAACLLAAGSLAVMVSLVTLSPAEPTPTDNATPSETGEWDFLHGDLEIRTLSVRIVNEEGQPIAGAEVTPIGLGSSKTHISWDEESKIKPILSGDDGIAKISYPHLWKTHEMSRQTTRVSLLVMHPDYGYIDLSVDVPPMEKSPPKITFPRGVRLELQPTIDGHPADLDNIYPAWPGLRHWSPEAVKRTASGTLQLPPIKPGMTKVRLVRLEGEKATHFSTFHKIDLLAGEPAQLEIPLLPAVTIHGVLSDNVPRPVRNGIVSIMALPQTEEDHSGWGTGRVIQPDGSFTIEGWPADETLQVIALCDGFHATSGTAPAGIKEGPVSSSLRPQVFEPLHNQRIEISMTPLVECVVDIVNQEGEPVADAWVGSSPNVRWWDGGAMLYCHPVGRAEKFLVDYDYRQASGNNQPLPFSGKTNAQGRIVLHVPAGRRSITVGSKGYEMPIFLGERLHRIQLAVGETTNVLIKLQPKGTESLREWDKLEGVIFGCSTRNGKSICALPGVQKKMEALRKRMREADNPRNPALLAEAYTAIAEALDGAGDAEEAAKWQVKAAEQAGKREEEKPEAPVEKPETATAAPSPFGEPESMAIDREVSAAYRLRQEKKTEEAIVLLSEALVKWPDNGQLLYARASMFNGVEHYTEAMADYEAARQPHRRNWFNAQWDLAYLLMNAKDESFHDPVRAAQLLEEITRPGGPYTKNWMPLSSLSKAYLRTGDLDAAIGAQRRAVAVSNESTYEKTLEVLHELQQRKKLALDTGQRIIRVRVVDEAGDPIEKAWIGLKLGLARYEEERVAFNDVYPTDAGGWCTLPIGEERWGSVWVRAKGYALLPPLDILNNQRIRELDGKSLTLKKAEGFELEVFNSHSGRVSIEMIHPTDELTQFWIPDDWSGVYSRRIDDYTIGSNVIQLLPDEENRRVHIPGIAPENVDQFLIAGGSGNVRFDRNFFWSLKQSDGYNSVKKLEKLGHKRLGESKYRITLPDAGNVRGRVVADEDGAPLSRPFQLESHPTGAIGYYGVATVTPDEQGRFEIERLADGYLKAAFKHKSDDPWRWSISPDLGVRAGTTTELMVTLERSRLLRGTMPLSPRTGDGINQPSIIEFNWGAKNQFGTITRTDREEGVYSAYVPTGKVRIRASLGPHNRQLQPKFFIQTEITVPEGEGEFTVPTPDADEISEDQPSNGWDVMYKGSGW